MSLHLKLLSLSLSLSLSLPTPVLGFYFSGEAEAVDALPPLGIGGVRSLQITRAPHRLWGFREDCDTQHGPGLSRVPNICNNYMSYMSNTADALSFFRQG